MTAKAFKPAEVRECDNFRTAPDQPENWRGWRLCLTCRRWGNPADPADRGHPPPSTGPPPPPRTRRERQIIAARAELDARILGEHDPE